MPEETSKKIELHTENARTYASATTPAPNIDANIDSLKSAIRLEARVSENIITVSLAILDSLLGGDKLIKD